SRLVSEARQQIQALVRETAAEAVSSEARPLIALLQNQLREAARHSVEAAAEQSLQSAIEHSVQASEARLQEMQERWNRRIEESVARATQELDAKLADVENRRRDAFATELEGGAQRAAENIGRATGSVDAHILEAQAKLEGFTGRAQEIADAAQ